MGGVIFSLGQLSEKRLQNVNGKDLGEKAKFWEACIRELMLGRQRQEWVEGWRDKGERSHIGRVSLRWGWNWVGRQILNDNFKVISDKLLILRNTPG